jgi:hypothetical protein
MDNQQLSPGMQVCPTRVDGAPVLFAHKVTQGQCQDRQRGHYHKCFTCAFNNAYVSKNGRPQARAALVELKKVKAG